MTGLRERNRARTRVDIEAAALELFERQGYDDTTVDQLATAAGVSSATFFRHFAAKEEVLFGDADETATALAAAVAGRRIRATTLAALVDPIADYAAGFVEDGSTHARRLTRLAMTTRSLEARSVRMRLRWEKAIALEFAQEHGRAQPEFDETLLASIAVSCLMTALRAWDDDSPRSLIKLVRRSFEHCRQLAVDPPDAKE